jgi:threonine dehydratase
MSTVKNASDVSYVTLPDILMAREVIAGKVHRTPTITATNLGNLTETELYFKAEAFQKTGSFKPRGATNKLNSLTHEEKARGVITISAGNHAAGVGYAASMMGIQATVVMPENAPQSKVEATRGYGVNVIQHGGMKDLLPKMQEIQEERNLTFVHPFDDPYIIAGQGTVGLEILEDVPAPDVVVVPIGGGGLISGVATAIKLKQPATKVIGVEPVGSSVMTQSLQQDEVMRLDTHDTIADGLAAPFTGKRNLAHVRRYVDSVALVTDDEIAESLKLILERCKIMTEPAGAAAFAALLHRKFDVAPGARVVCILSGGNIDQSRLKTIL